MTGRAALLLAYFALVPLAFSRYVPANFEVPKGLLLMLCVCSCAALAALEPGRAREWARGLVRDRLALSALAFAAASVLSALGSICVSDSFWSGGIRFAGGVPTLLYVALFLELR